MYHALNYIKYTYLPSSVQFQLASSVELSLALILVITSPPHPPPGESIFEAVLAYIGS